MRAWPMMLSFILVGFVTFLFEEWRYGNNVFETWTTYFLVYPTLFLGFFMLTEPFTLPPTKSMRMGYGALVGFLSSTALFVPLFAMTPELALILGNLAAYPYTLKRKLLLIFREKREIGPLLYELTFTKPAGFTFQPGQYVEWMLPHNPTDARGIRRYFTILSSPTESVVRLGCKIPTPGSSYKQALLGLKPGDVIIGSQLAGDFLLPEQSTQKIAWVAGGIGVTPFVSQVQYLGDSNETRDIVLLYAANSPAELVYQKELAAVATVVPVLANGALPGSESGFLTGDIITRRVPDYLDRTWYISGPPGMVNATVKTLSTLGVSKRHIVKDFFPGLA
jgi:glycine betaine catabolism B